MGRGGSWGILSAEASPDTQRSHTPACILGTHSPPSPGAAAPTVRPAWTCCCGGGRPAVTSLRCCRGEQSQKVRVRMFWDSGPRGCDPRLGARSPRGLRRCRPESGGRGGDGCCSAPPLNCTPLAPPCLPRVSRLASGTAPLHSPQPGTRRRVGSARRPGPSGPHTAFPLWVTQMPTRGVWRHRKGQTGEGHLEGTRLRRDTPSKSAPDSVIQTASSEDPVLWPCVKDSEP